MVGAPRGGSRISGWGRWRAVGPERGAVGAKLQSAERVGSGKGRLNNVSNKQRKQLNIQQNTAQTK